MQAYGIDYEINGRTFTTNIDAKNIQSARNKLARKHKVNPEDVKITKTIIIGYY